MKVTCLVALSYSFLEQPSIRVTCLVALRPYHDQVKEKQIQTRTNFPEKNKVEKEILTKQKKFKQTTDFAECYRFENLPSKYLARFDKKNNKLH